MHRLQQFRMVKLSNKGKGKPTKRKTLKQKYKIQRKVNQHKKKMRRESKKLYKSGIKPKKNLKNNMLPNSYPFKMQILQQFKSERPQQDAPTNLQLDSCQWALLALQNNPKYLPKDKDHLTKKYFTNESKIWEYANCILEVLDARNINACLSPELDKKCTQKNVRHLYVVTKTDTISAKKLQAITSEFNKLGKEVVEFSMDPKRKNKCLENLIEKVEGDGKKCNNSIVMGKALTGKHTIIKQLMKYIKFHNEDYATIYDVKISPSFRIIDTPFKTQDQSEYPLFHVPSSLDKEKSLMSQQEKILNSLFITNNSSSLKLNKPQTLLHYCIQNYISLDDFLKKVGKANRMFGKGGMVDIGMVRTKILSEWYAGKLNHLFI